MYILALTTYIMFEYRDENKTQPALLFFLCNVLFEFIYKIFDFIAKNEKKSPTLALRMKSLLC